jgi:predicted amidohydrolase YtcJ
MDSGNRGFPAVDPQVYRQQVQLFVDAGVGIGTHAIGDRAIDWVVESYAEALRHTPKQGLRLAIIHANEPTGHAIETMAMLQRQYDSGIPETQAEFLWWLGDAYPPGMGLTRIRKLVPLQSYLQHGLIWAGGSDASVTPLAARYGLWASVARQPLTDRYGAQPFGTAESVDVHTALRSYTIWAARQLFIERQTGSLEVGKSADIAVWDRDPYSVETIELKNLKCELTVFKGSVVYEAKR